MARWREIAADLRRRIQDGEFDVGTPLPTITQLQQHYSISGPTTIRQAQAPLIDEGLLEARPGIGVFVVSTAGRPVGRDHVLAELRAARDRLNHAIELLEQADLP